MKVEIYCDGSGQTASGPGGWGYVVVVDGVERHRASGGIASATNNVAEVTAAIRGLEYIESNPLMFSNCDVTLVSDSQLALGYASGRYSCKALHLLPLYIQVKKLYKKLNAKDRWVKGHAGDQYNEICDKLAKAARNQILDPTAASDNTTK